MNIQHETNTVLKVLSIGLLDTASHVSRSVHLLLHTVLKAVCPHLDKPDASLTLSCCIHHFWSQKKHLTKVKCSEELQVARGHVEADDDGANDVKGEVDIAADTCQREGRCYCGLCVID